MGKWPNILLISIDSLRSTNLSAYGYHRETSPNLDKLSTEGILFENAIAPANWTGAAIASILTGLYPTSHGYTNLRYYLDEDVETIASILQQKGYHTLCLSNNIYITPETGLTRGYMNYWYRGKAKKITPEPKDPKTVNYLPSLKQKLSLRSRYQIKDVLDVFNKKNALTRDDGAFQTENAFLQWFKGHNKSTPFFAFIHYQEPHSIYFPPTPFRQRFFNGSLKESLRYLDFDHIGYYGGTVEITEQQMQHYQDLYDGEIAYIDWRLGRLFQFLRQENVLDETIVIVTADHGECMGENGYIWHAFCLYDPLIRVPLFIRFPEWFKKGDLLNNLVQTNDIVPTLLEGLGITWCYQDYEQGQSFLNGASREATYTESFNPEKMVKRWVNRNNTLGLKDYSQFLRDLRCYRTCDKKFVMASDGRREYYNLKADPGEENNIYNGHDKQINKIEKALNKRNASLQPHVADDTQPGFSKDTWQKMKDLGYA